MQQFGTANMTNNERLFWMFWPFNIGH